MKEKEMVCMTKETFTHICADVTSDLINELAETAKKNNMDFNPISEILLTAMFTSKLAHAIFTENETTENNTTEEVF